MASLADKFNMINNLTLSNDIKMISIEELHDSADNFFEMSEIEKLAESILLADGIKENLIVTPHPDGGYEIVSGHRRKAAVQMLLDKGENVSPKLPCLVVNYKSQAEKEMHLILMNISQREMRDSDKYQSCIRLNEDLKALGKEKGSGKIRDMIHEITGISTGTINKINKIDNNAIPEIKDAVLENKVTINKAQKISELPESVQMEYVNNEFANTSDKELDEVTEKFKKKNTTGKKGVNLDTENSENKKSVKVDTLNKEDNHKNNESLLEFISANKAKLAETINELMDCLDSGSSEQALIAQFVSKLAEFKL